MKIQVLRNARGEVVAAFERTPGALVSVEAQPGEGERLEEMDLSELGQLEQGISDLLQQIFQPSKMLALRNARGEVVAAFERTPGALVSVEAQPGEGERLEEMDLSGLRQLG
jgi:hypothetical protein